MIKSFITIVAIGGISFFYTDIESSSIVLSILFPIIDFLVLVAMGLWFVILFHRGGISQTSGSSGDASFFGDGDAGGGDA